MKFTILNKLTLANIPSASGIEILDGTMFVIGDNSPWLFKLDTQYNVIEQVPIASTNVLVKNQIPKPFKPDFEAMTSIKSGTNKELLIFGSGSKSPERDVMLRINIQKQSDTKTYSLKNLYEKIRMDANISKGDLNIEAAVADNEKLYLFNRGKNMVFIFSLSNFLEHVNNNKISPYVKIIHFKLPEINGIEAGFSGATITPDEKTIVFTASVEKTTNWIDDGEILGSFIGTLNLKALEEEKRPVCIQLSDKTIALKIKVESVAVRHADTNNTLHLLLITDSDGGKSELLEASLNLT